MSESTSSTHFPTPGTAAAFCISFSFAFFSSSSLFLTSSSSSNFLEYSAAAARKRSVEASTASPDAPASTGRPGVGRPSPTERRTVRALRCGPGSKRLPGRTPGSGGFCARRPSCCSCSTPSLALAPVFGPRGAAFCCALWTVCCSCRHHERSRRSRRRLATPPAEGRTLDSAIISQLHVGKKKKKQHGHKPV